MKRIVLVGGGVRSGKSDFALRRASRLGERRVFVATGESWDDEMRSRIEAHRRERDASFVTVEEPVEVARAIRDAASADVVLVDCLTLFLSNLLCRDLDDAGVMERVTALEQAIDDVPASIVLVTNEVGLGIVPENAMARRFRDLAGTCHSNSPVSECDP